MPQNNLEKNTLLEEKLSLKLVEVAEHAAIAAAKLRGHGDEKAADQAAVDAMRTALNRMEIDGCVVIGEGERDEAPMLYIGEKVGTQSGLQVDIALDPLEGTTLCAKNLPHSLAVISIAPKGHLLFAPDVYMQKIAIGPGYPKGVINIDASPIENIQQLAKAKNVSPKEIGVCIMDRPRHADLIEQVRATGASISLISDGDVAAIIRTTQAARTGIDIYMSIGGAPEGVLASSALRCLGGQMQGRLVFDSEEKIKRAKQMGVEDPHKVYTAEEMAKGEVLFVAAGVTDGDIVSGVKWRKNYIETETLLLCSGSGTMRKIKTSHPYSGISK